MGPIRCPSLRTRFRIGATLATSVLLALSAFTVYALIQRALLKEFDNALGTQVRTLAALVDHRGQHLRVVYNAEQFPEYARDRQPEYFCYRLADDGSELYASPSLEVVDWSLPRLAGTAEKPEVRALVLPDGHHGRAAGLRFTPKNGDLSDQVELVVARSTQDLDHEMQRIWWLLLTVGIGSVLATVVAMELLVRLLLRPVDRLALRIAAIHPDHLVMGVEGCQVPQELEPVVRRLEDLLARLAAAFRRERAFADDVAHELRTPLSGLRTTIEVILAREREPAAYRAALEECLGICLQTQGLADNLLALARAEGGQLVPNCLALSLDRVLEETWQLLATEMRARNLSRRWTVPPLTVKADAGLLRQLFINLFSNAAAYADQNGLVSVEAADVRGWVEVTIANTGCTLQPEQAERVFDRFWRGDQARKGTGTHAGLGLALSKTLVALHGGTIVARVGNGWFTIIVRLPGVPAAEHKD